LRFDVLHCDREAVLTKIREQDWSPIYCSDGQRFHRDTLLPCQTFELDLPREKPPVHDRRIHGELADPSDKIAVETRAMMYHVYGKQKP
jgi:hypothetical protein